MAPGGAVALGAPVVRWPVAPEGAFGEDLLQSLLPEGPREEEDGARLRAQRLSRRGARDGAGRRFCQQLYIPTSFYFSVWKIQLIRKLNI